jgi:hypothetical protein
MGSLYDRIWFSLNIVPAPNVYSNSSSSLSPMSVCIKRLLDMSKISK